MGTAREYHRAWVRQDTVVMQMLTLTLARKGWEHVKSHREAGGGFRATGMDSGPCSQWPERE